MTQCQSSRRTQGRGIFHLKVTSKKTKTINSIIETKTMKTKTPATKTKTTTTTECQPRRILGGGISLTSKTTTEQATAVWNGI